jgi:hypothetical protein
MHSYKCVTRLLKTAELWIRGRPVYSLWLLSFTASSLIRYSCARSSSGLINMADNFTAVTDEEDRPLDNATASTALRHLRPEQTIVRSELSDFTLHRNQREVRSRISSLVYRNSSIV